MRDPLSPSLLIDILLRDSPNSSVNILVWQLFLSSKAIIMLDSTIFEEASSFYIAEIFGEGP